MSSSKGGALIAASALAAGLLTLLPAPAKAAPSFGSLTQLSGKFGCANDDGAEGCTVGGALDGAASVAVSPDGRHLYAASNNSGSVTTFRRGRRGGLIAESSCVGNAPLEGCVPARGLVGAFSVAVSPDGRDVYVAGFRGVAAFVRDRRSGSLSQPAGSAGCVNQDGSEGCARGRGLVSPASLTLSPDGRNLYVASSGGSGTVAVFARDSETGAIAQLQGPEGCVGQGVSTDCISGRALAGAFGVVVSPNGRHAYVTALNSNAVAVFERDQDDGALIQLRGSDGCVSQSGIEGCALGRGLDGPNSAAVSPDGRNVYVASSGSGAVAAFARDESGALDQLEGPLACTSQGGTDGCATGRALGGAYGLTVSLDGVNAYAVSSTAVVSLLRDPLSGALTELEPPEVCTSQDGTENCLTGRGLLEASSVALPADGNNAYVASYVSDAVATFARNPQRTRPRIRIRGMPRPCARRSFKATVNIRSKLPVQRVGVYLDRTRLGRRDRVRRLIVRIATHRLSRGRHRFRVHATDVGGNTRRRTVGFRRCT